MMKGTIKTMAPEMNGAEQKTYSGAHGLMYCFICEMTDGVKGQVSSKSPAPHRFASGDVVEYTYTPATNPAYTGRLKVEKPKDEHAGNGQASNGAAPQRGWTPEKEASVMIQGLLKSVIESGIPSDKWEEATAKALSIHDALHVKRAIPQPAY